MERDPRSIKVGWLMDKWAASSMGKSTLETTLKQVCSDLQWCFKVLYYRCGPPFSHRFDPLHGIFPRSALEEYVVAGSLRS